MGCVVNGPGECEGADVAIFGGKGRGIIYVQGEQKQTVTEDKMMSALLHECREFAARKSAPARPHSKTPTSTSPRPPHCQEPMGACR
jgi:4-hydroxy-3-methylbut-2-en-1-yl diphosphate synthase IspG/GcpE